MVQHCPGRVFSPVHTITFGAKMIVVQGWNEWHIPLNVSIQDLEIGPLLTGQESGKVDDRNPYLRVRELSFGCPYCRLHLFDGSLLRFL